MNEKFTILIVDDTPENIDVLVHTLESRYKVKIATNGAMALKIVEQSSPDLILLDIMMPDIDGYEVCQKLKEDYTTRHIPIIFITAMTAARDELKGLQLGAADYVTKPISPPILKARIATQLALQNQNRELDRKVSEVTQQLHETRLQIIQRLGRAAEYKDDETGTHVIRMSYYSKALGLAAGMNEREAELLVHAAPMHDIGKIGIPDKILKKPGPLTDREFAVMRKHCVIGAQIIGDDDSELLQMAKDVAISHHEKWNGTGYPKKLKAEEIPRIGRIIAITDVFDALTSKRPYKEAWPLEKAFDLMQREAGEHFDPLLIDVFFNQALPHILDIYDTYKEV